MAKYKGADLAIAYDNSGGTPVTMTQYVETLSNAAIEHAMEDSHTFGDSWREQLPANLKSVPDITLGGKYDDTATTGPLAIWGAQDNSATRTLTITWGGSNTFGVECYLKSFRITGRRGVHTMFEAVLAATGAVTVGA